MIISDMHIHSSFSDGEDLCEDIVKEAVLRGFKSIGFSEHSFVPFDAEGTLLLENTEAYKKEVLRLKEKYAGQINIYTGLEMDFFSGLDRAGYDYIIGSSHYVKVGGEYMCVDYSVDNFEKGVKKYFGGDYFKCCEAYYETVSEIYEKTHCDIVGHFDLVSKFNDVLAFIDEESDAYMDMVKSAAERIVKKCSVFEINTGAVARGNKREPYPSKRIMKLLSDMGASFILSSDAHKKENIAYGFEGFENVDVKTVYFDGKFLSSRIY